MEVKVNAVNFKADGKLIEFVKEKVSKLERHAAGLLQADVTLSEDKEKVADIRVVVRGNDLYASKQASSFEEAVMLSIDALKSQINKFKEK
ncbi:MAG: HPF/RaiA family ribosome-associated protein [Bacteroidales bacterium]|nr:HPF/RaiA family ribosome-associated protein [Bacteroidales bacterium]MBQ7984992.1 HPF/RaiA family ribosome-associated protein [Bacteroidales bacterium]